MADPAFDPECLHCLVSRVLDDFLAARGADPDVTGANVILRLEEVVADFILTFPDEGDQVALIRSAHWSLDRAIARRRVMPATVLPSATTAH